MTESLLLVVILVVIVGAVILFLSSPSGKGEIGELNIIALISREIRRGLYGCVLQNIYVPKADGGTSEIDVVLVCTKGIFVFESKNYAGYIFGDDTRKFWTVTLYAGKDWLGFKHIEKHKFYNPIWQNKTHIRNLRKLVGSQVPMYSMVVFSNRSVFKNVVFDASNATVIHTSALKYHLSDIRTSYQDALSQEGVDRLYQKLLPLRDLNEGKKQSHLMYVNELKYNPAKCPRCGGDLVVRTAKKGANAGRQFYGCSNYPTCKYTRDL